jgi:hypothetical protein
MTVRMAESLKAWGSKWSENQKLIMMTVQTARDLTPDSLVTRRQ